MIRQMMKKTLLFLCVFMLGATGALAAYPDHPITLVVPFGAGGGTDIPARLLAGMMEKRLGQPIVVQNVSGAGGTLGVAQVAAAKPDGYTLGYVPTGTMCLQPHVMKLPYGTDAFDFIGTSVSQPVVLMTAKKRPVEEHQRIYRNGEKEPQQVRRGHHRDRQHDPCAHAAVCRALRLEAAFHPLPQRRGDF